MIIAHGTIMGICFAFMLPLGSITIRFLSSSLAAPIKLHYTIQLIAFGMILVPSGLGVYLSIGLQFMTFRTLSPFCFRYFASGD
jgi:hypothetical protein